MSSKTSISAAMALLNAEECMWEINERNRKIGSISYKIYNSERNLRKENCGIADICKFISSERIFPLAVIYKIKVNESKRGRKVGTLAMQTFLEYLKENKVLFTMLRVGDVDLSLHEGRMKAVRLAGWYERMRFTPFIHNGVKIVVNDISAYATDAKWCWFWKMLAHNNVDIPT
ncbi:MAG: hypothetical protein WCO97_05010 [bacterium]